MTLRVFESRYVAMCRNLLVTTDDMCFVTVMITAGSEVGGNDRRGNVGTTVLIEQMYATEEGGYTLIGSAKNRCSIVEWLPDDPYPQARVDELDYLVCGDAENAKLCSQLTTMSQRVRSILHMVAEQKSITLQPMPTLTKLASGQWWEKAATPETLETKFWDLVRHVPCGSLDRYALMQKDNWRSRLETLGRIIDHVSELIAFQGFSASDDDV